MKVHRRPVHTPTLTPKPESKGIFSQVRDFLGDIVVSGDYADDPARRMRNYAITGAGAGALIGAAIGTVHGFEAQTQNSIQEYNSTENVIHHRLDGYHYSIVPDYDRECETVGSGEDAREVCHDELEGWWHNYSPDIDRTIVDSYQQPRYRHTEFWEPLRGGLLGALGGGLLGLGVGVSAALLQNAVVQDDFANPGKPILQPEQRQQAREFSGNAALMGGLVGAGVGAYLGSVAGGVELGQEQVFTRSYMAPVLQREYLGDIPRDWYQHNWGWGWPNHSRDFSHGREAVYRNNPVYDGGQVRYQRVSETFETGRYGKVAGGIMGGLVGLGVGVATGLATGMVGKMVMESAQDAEVPGKKEGGPPPS